MAKITRRPTACVDLDGTILEYDGWVGVGKFGAVMAGAKDALVALKEQGWKLIIYTCRYEEELIRNYLRAEGVPFDEINRNSDVIGPAVGETKPFADVYIDDRGIGFRGDWGATLAEVYEFMAAKGDESRLVHED